jgi:Ser/Thr protein kinase RdoA (MazF antagonist)
VTNRAVTAVEELNPALLSEILDAEISAVDAEAFGIGNVSDCFRLVLSYAGGSLGPAALVAKLPSSDPALKAANARQAKSEVGFYREIAPVADIAVPRCFHAAASDDGEQMLLLLEEMSPLAPVDQLSGCSPAQAMAAAANVAGLHRSTWNRADLRDLPFLAPLGLSMAELLQATVTGLTPGFVDRFSLRADDEAILHAYGEALGRWFHGRTDHYSLIHNDYRIDNLLFTPDLDGTRPVVVVDWGTISAGLPGRDLAYLVATSLEVDDRRAHERSIVAHYNDALNANGTLQSFDDSWDDYLYGLFQVLLICVAASVHSVRSDRTDQMFSAMIGRAFDAIRDHDAVSLLP